MKDLLCVIKKKKIKAASAGPGCVCFTETLPRGDAQPTSLVLACVGPCGTLSSVQGREHGRVRHLQWAAEAGGVSLFWFWGVTPLICQILAPRSPVVLPAQRQPLLAGGGEGRSCSASLLRGSLGWEALSRAGRKPSERVLVQGRPGTRGRAAGK